MKDEASVLTMLPVSGVLHQRFSTSACGPLNWEPLPGTNWKKVTGSTDGSFHKCFSHMLLLLERHAYRTKSESFETFLPNSCVSEVNIFNNKLTD
jgi:hypothetical protein